MKDSMGTDNCGTVQSMLADYSVENLGWFTTRTVRKHLSECAECSRELDLLLSAVELVEEVGHREPPRGLWNGIYNRIAVGQEKPETRPLPRTGWLRRRAFSLVGGLAVVLLALGMIMGRMDQPNFPDALDVVAYEYVEAHARLSQEQPFADKINLALIAAGSGSDKVDNAEH